ncbi:hypothetical protein [Micromonospora sp. KLBMP9576]|uniref:hypothetical protein n=1 Tax=Micromonospora sp. KLBMP9576 TaxID=3424769 RepID=UPI003D8C762E
MAQVGEFVDLLTPLQQGLQRLVVHRSRAEADLQEGQVQELQDGLLCNYLRRLDDRHWTILSRAADESTRVQSSFGNRSLEDRFRLT